MRIFLAGVEQYNEQQVARFQIRDAFYSYYYIRNSGRYQQNIETNRPYHETIFVDSGAHSFFSENHALGLSVANLRRKTKTVETPDEYMARYLAWLEANYERFDYYAELDIGELVGQKKVEQWRRDLKKKGLFDKCVTVYHPGCMTSADYTRMLRESASKYIALEGDRSNRPRLQYTPLIKRAYDRGVRVHGFAMTKRDVMETYPFYSVDSTSWKAGIMYGSMLVTKGTDPSYVNMNRRDSVVSGFLPSFNMTRLHSEDKKVQNEERLHLSARAFEQLSNRYTQLWQARNVRW